MGPGLLPDSACAWLRGRETVGTLAPMTLTDRRGRQLQLSFIGQIGGDELLLRLAEDSSDGHIRRLRESLALTGREAEVLLWVWRGKSSRDIGEILGLSPRTVTKHLEQVYAKLGVENRTSAAAAANRCLQDGST